MRRVRQYDRNLQSRPLTMFKVLIDASLSDDSRISERVVYLRVLRIQRDRKRGSL